MRINGLDQLSLQIDTFRELAAFHPFSNFRLVFRIPPKQTFGWGHLTWASATFMRAEYRRSMRYFFDTRDNGSFIEDEVGVELNGFEAAKELAALSLAELAKDVLPGSTKRVLAVEVRDEAQPVLRDVLTFEAVTLTN